MCDAQYKSHIISIFKENLFCAVHKISPKNPYWYGQVKRSDLNIGKLLLPLSTKIAKFCKTENKRVGRYQKENQNKTVTDKIMT